LIGFIILRNIFYEKNKNSIKVKFNFLFSILLKMSRKKFAPIILFESFDQNGELKSVIQYVNRKDETSKYCLIPKWCMGLASLFCAFILLILFSAIFIVSTASRPGLYKESCVGRSCVKDFGLVCKNYTCDCPTGYLYIDKCTYKKTFLEKCNGNQYCLDNTNLVCLDGVCKCNTTQYWNNKICTNVLTYGISCKTDIQCNSMLNLYCDLKYGICGCDSSRLVYLKMLY
jgi:hypothetical protein